MIAWYINALFPSSGCVKRALCGTVGLYVLDVSVPSVISGDGQSDVQWAVDGSEQE